MGNKYNLVAIDFESFYSEEYSLRLMSPYSYVHHELFDAYMMSVYDGGGISWVGRPEDFDWALIKDRIPCAHNASFDKHVYLRLVELGKVPSVLPENWLCSADMAAYLGVKRSLKAACLQLMGRVVSKKMRTEAKDMSVKDLEKNPEMLEYAMEDAINCFDLLNRFLDQWPEKERRISQLNRQTAMRGFRIDVKQALAGYDRLRKLREEQEERIPWVWEHDESGKRIEDPNNPGHPLRIQDKKERQKKGALCANALKAYAAKQGVQVPASLAKDNPEFLDWLQVNADRVPWIDAVGKFRSLNTFTLRLRSLATGYDENDRFIYEKKYYGAFTGRFSGGSNTDSGGKFNMENIPAKEMYGVNFRSMFIAKPGHVLLIADYDQIEARCLLWRAGDTEALAPCFNGASVYQAYAEKHGITPVGVILKETDKAAYKHTKVIVLQCGYQCGWNKYQAVAKAQYGLIRTDEEAKKDVCGYREANKPITDFWAEHNKALHFSARRQDDTHEIELASGRNLVYWKPRFHGREVSATQVRGMGATNLYGGKITENEMQATCRDILCDAWLELDKAGFPPVVLTVHDELVCEVPEDEVENRKEEMVQIMTHCSPWAEGLPLGVGVDVSKVYIKG